MADKNKITVSIRQAARPKNPRTVLKKQTVSKNNDSSSLPKQTGKEDRSVFKVSLAIVITAVIVGGGIYVWQKKIGEMNIKELSNDARTTRIGFEERLSEIKGRLDSKNEDFNKLVDEKIKLEEKAKLLENAKLSYTNEELGLSFEYPARLGEVQAEEKEMGDGTKGLFGTFSESEAIKFGAVDKDYIRASTTGEQEFLDFSGYAEEAGKYFLKISGNSLRDYMINPVKEIEAGSGKVLLLDKSSIEYRNKEAAKINLGENMGAVINLKNVNYPGVAFLNTDFGIMPPAEFEAMLSSVSVR